MKIYLLSGLGADSRIFDRLDFGRMEPRLLDWIPPKDNESLTAYCQRLVEGISDDDEVMLLGVSFGGMVAQEIARVRPCSKLVLISTVQSVDELSFPVKILRSIRLDRLLSGRVLRRFGIWFGAWFFSVRGKAETSFLREIMADTDPDFLRWAVDRIMVWQGGPVPCPVLRIHGDADRIFPIRRIRDVHTIAGGGHFMIVQRGEEVVERVLNS